MTTATAPDASANEFEIELEAPEQRASERRGASSLVGVLDIRGSKVPVRIDDLSLRGVGVTTATRLPDNEDCRLDIQLTVCGADYSLFIKSRVRHCEPLTSRSYHAGLQFIEMSDATRDTLKLLIR